MTVRLIINKGVAYLPFNHPMCHPLTQNAHTHANKQTHTNTHKVRKRKKNDGGEKLSILGQDILLVPLE
jgi:hypothetical protein